MKPTAMYRILALSIDGDWKRRLGTLMICSDGKSQKAIYVDDASGDRTDIDFNRIDVGSDDWSPTRKVIVCSMDDVIVAEFISYRSIPVDGDTVRMCIVRAVSTPKARIEDGKLV